jgi:hypothetical protein
MVDCEDYAEQIDEYPQHVENVVAIRTLQNTTFLCKFNSKIKQQL